MMQAGEASGVKPLVQKKNLKITTISYEKIIKLMISDNDLIYFRRV